MTQVEEAWVDALDAAAILKRSRQRVHQIAHTNTGTAYPIRSKWVEGGNAGYWLYHRGDCEARARKLLQSQ